VEITAGWFGFDEEDRDGFFRGAASVRDRSRRNSAQLEPSSLMERLSSSQQTLPLQTSAGVPRLLEARTRNWKELVPPEGPAQHCPTGLSTPEFNIDLFFPQVAHRKHRQTGTRSGEKWPAVE